MLRWWKEKRVFRTGGRKQEDQFEGQSQFFLLSRHNLDFAAPVFASLWRFTETLLKSSSPPHLTSDILYSLFYPFRCFDAGAIPAAWEKRAHTHLELFKENCFVRELKGKW
jgi:hypothetical protein